MKKGAIFYFTQGGTTASVAEKIASGLEAGGSSVELKRIQEKPEVNPDKYDFIGIGFPVYIFRIPFPVEEFIKKIPPLNGKPFFIFLLYGSVSGKAGSWARKLMEKKGGTEVGYSSYTGNDVYVGYLRRGYLFSPWHPLENELEEAFKFGKNLNYILDGADYLKPSYEPGPGIIFTLERLLTVKPMVNYFYRYFFKVDKDKCSQCGICIKNCPSGNIHYGPDRLPRFGSSCICCWYCDMKCPEEAISTPLNWPVFSLFNMYNIKKTLKNDAVKYERVKLERGKVIRLSQQKR